MPINSEHLASLTDADVIDQNGDKVGGVGQIYLDDATGQPAWVSVKSGLFGMRESFVPLRTADVVDGNISVPFTKDFIKDAPRVDADNHLDDSQQSTLYSYYGVERPSADAGEPEQRASFSSEETADEDAAGRTEGLPTAAESEEALTPEPASGDSAPDPAVTGEPAAAAEAAELQHATETAETTQAVPAPGDAAAAGAAAPGDEGWDESQHATYQQENPAANQDWAAEQAPDEPVSTDWSMPTTDPADEEATDVARSGYSPDRPAAHSSAYEGHHVPAPADSTEVDTAEQVGAESGPHDGADAATGGDAADEVPAGDDAVTGAPDQTGTGYPAESEITGEAPDEESPETDDGQAGSGAALGGAALGGAVVGGAAAGVAASDTDTTAYEVPGAETGTPTTDAAPGEEFAADREAPFDAGTAPVADDVSADEAPGVDAPGEDAAGTFEAGTDGGDASGEPDLSGNDPETFGPTGYRPDRDGEDMSDEERERLNRARGAL